MIIPTHNTTHNEITYQNRLPNYKLFVALSPIRGLLSQMGTVDGFDRKGAPPDHGGAGLGPWTFRVGSVDAFGGSFMWFL